MKSQMIILMLFFEQVTYSQNVGINVDTPKATLHVAGTVRIDSFKSLVGSLVPLAVDSLGNLVKNTQMNSLLDQTIPLVYGESINVGDLVAIGDGLTGYLSAEQQTSPFTSVTVPMGEWIAQSFITSLTAKGIKAVQFRAGANQTTFTVKIRRCVNGIPSGPDLGTASYFHQANNAAAQFLLVFDPPVMVSPNTAYAFIIDWQKVGGISNPFFYSNANFYSNGLRLHSSNGGNSWTSFAAQDMVFCVYETQTQNARVYKAATCTSAVAILDGATNHSYSTSNEDYFGAGDRFDNIIGVAAQSGAAGETKGIFIGQPCSGFNNLVPGTDYYMSNIPGQVSVTKPPGSLVRKVGFSVTSQKMMIK